MAKWLATQSLLVLACGGKFHGRRVPGAAGLLLALGLVACGTHATLAQDGTAGAPPTDAASDTGSAADAASDAAPQTGQPVDAEGLATEVTAQPDAGPSVPVGCPPDPAPLWATPELSASTIAPPPGRQCALPGWPGPVAAAPLVFEHDPTALPLEVTDNVDRCLIWRDLDHDGREDFAFVQFPSKLLGKQKLVIGRGQPDGTLKWESHPVPLKGMMMDCLAVDLQRDGVLEIVIASANDVRVFATDAASAGSEVTTQFWQGSYPAIATLSAFDFDQDGDEDLYLGTNKNVGIDDKTTCEYADSGYITCCLDKSVAACMAGKSGTSKVFECCPAAAVSPHRLLRNDGGKLVDVTSQLNLDSQPAVSISPHDIDRDGRQDYFVADDYGHHGWSLNRGAKVDFLGAGIGMRPYAHSMGAVAMDFDGDHRDHVLMSDSGSASLYRGTDTGFVDVSAQWNISSALQETLNWATLAEDLDHDGWPDGVVTVSTVAQKGTYLQLSSGGPTLPGFHVIAQNQGDHFATQQVVWPTKVLSAFTFSPVVAADWDHDNDLDLIFHYGLGKVGVWRNKTVQSNHWLTVRVVDSHGPVMGAIVQVWAQGHVQERQVHGVVAFGASHRPVAHFGLGPVQQLDRVRVWWPNGTVQDIDNVAADQELTLQKP